MSAEQYSRREFVPDARPALDLGELFLLLWQRKVLIIAVSLAFAALAVVAALLLPRIYRAEALLAPSVDRSASSGLGELAGRVEGLASLAGIDFQGGGTPKEAVALLRSRGLGEDLIRRKKLVAVLTDGDGTTVRRAYSEFDDNVRTVREDRGSGLVTLAIDWTDPAVAADWANSLVALANEITRTRAIKDAESRLRFLDNALGTAKSVELRQAIFRLIEAEVKTRMLASVRQDAAFRVIDAATVADSDEYVSPNGPLMVAFAWLLGLAVGILAAYARVVRARGRYQS